MEFDQMASSAGVGPNELEDEREVSAQYDAATLSVYRALKGVAKRKGWIGYEELNRECSLGLDLGLSHDRDVIGGYAGAVSTYEVRKGRPMLSAILVHAKSPREPGPGFYHLAAELGRYRKGDTDKQVWFREFGEVHNYWSRYP